MLIISGIEGNEQKAVEIANSKATKNSILFQEIKKLPIMVIGNKLDVYVKDSEVKMSNIHERKNNCKRLEKILNLITKDLKRNFGFPDMDNVMILSKNSSESCFKRIDAFIKSASGYQGDIDLDGEDINAKNYVLDMCLFLKRFSEEFSQPDTWVQRFIAIFWEQKTGPLPI